MKQSIFDSKKFALITILLCTVIILIVNMRIFISWINQGFIGFSDPDPYMKMLNVLELYKTKDWYTHIIPKDNFPYGDYIPWTRPFDSLLFVGALLLKPFFGFKKGLLIWGVVLNPILEIATLFLLAWAIKPLRLGKIGFLTVLLTWACHPNILFTYTLGRADHHGLLTTWFILFLGLLFRCFCLTLPNQRLLFLGIIGGIGIWLSPEFLSAVLITYVIFGFLWLVRDPNHTALNTLFLFTTGLLSTLFIGMMSEHPFPQWFTIEHDRLSIVHLTFFTGIFIILLFLKSSFISKKVRSFTAKVSLSTFILVGAFFVLNKFFPSFYKGPLAAVNPSIKTIWFDHIGELNPFYKLSFHENSITYLIYIISILTLGVWLFELKRKKQNVSSTNKFNDFIWTLLTLSTVYMILTASMYRWNYYFVTSSIIFFGMIWKQLWQSLARSLPKWHNLKLLYTFIPLMTLILSSAFLGALEELNPTSLEKSYEQQMSDQCHKKLSLLVQQGNLKKILGDKVHSVMIPGNQSTELLYWAGLGVVGSNFTRNVEGIKDTHTFFNTDSFHEAKKILKKRHIQAIVFCRPYTPKFDKNKVIYNLSFSTPPLSYKKIYGTHPTDPFIYLFLPNLKQP